MDILKALGSETRRGILKILTKNSAHISAIARELGISVPAALKHINILQSASLVEKKNVGNAVVLGVKDDAIKLLRKLEDLLEKPVEVPAKKGITLYMALKAIDGFKMKKWPGTGRYYIYSIDNVKGDYIFQVNGKIPKVSVDGYKLKEDAIIEFHKLAPVIGKRLEVKVS